MSCLLHNFPTEAGDSCFYRNKQTELVWIRNLGTREVASEEPTVLYTGPDMTKIFHASSYAIFIEIQSNHWRKKLRRRNQDSNFLWGSLRAPIKFKRKIQLWDLKRWFLLENRPNHFIINSSSFIRQVEFFMKQVEFFQQWNQEATSFPSSVFCRSESNSEANFNWYHKSDAWPQFTMLQIQSSGRSLMYTRKSVESRMECAVFVALYL